MTDDSISILTLDMQGAASEVEISEDLIRKFDRPGPRYTSYPTADRFHGEFTEQSYQAYLKRRAQDRSNPSLSIYIHLPFCESLCYFCACNKIVTQDHSRVTEYLHYLEKEMALTASLMGQDRDVAQLHLGGGTPTFFNSSELHQLMSIVRRHFQFVPNAELGVEIDPRTVRADTLEMLADLGFNRNSFGVQDFDPDVQKSVNRIQPVEMVEKSLTESRSASFLSTNVDLIYGLPKQTLKSFSRTLDDLIRLSPDRIALYNYAHLPGRFKAQRLIVSSDLPSAEERLRIFLMATQRLLEAGYVYIGLDHFAKPDDELNKARIDGTLHRNFQGYTTYAEADLIGFGVSAIGKVGDSYSQSSRNINVYSQRLEQGHLPIERGFELAADDLLRRDVIMTIMCSAPLGFDAIRHKYEIEFQRYFAHELALLEPYAEAGLIELTPSFIRISPKGRLFVRAISMVFDKYLQQPTASSYSKLI